MIVLCGALSIVYAIWATSSVLSADQGNARMQEIAGGRPRRCAGLSEAPVHHDRRRRHRDLRAARLASSAGWWRSASPIGAVLSGRRPASSA
ncbi:MAG: hypothetical protein MZV49_02820 [Rhodopseudomonas palustris]|nr:hypothetical protein [Rhodopseudomonas palustris]